MGLARMYQRSLKLWRVLREPAYRGPLRRGVAASVEHDQMPWREDFGTVIDVGANKGQFVTFAAKRFTTADLICLEPLPDACRRLRQVVPQERHVLIYNVAAGARESEAELHVAHADDSSSLLKITDRQTAAFPGTHEARAITVPVRPLDDVVARDHVRRPALVKIDVQGSELDVLRGGSTLLGAVDALLVEASFVELYAGQALVDGVWSFLHERGFRCLGVWGPVYDRAGRCLQSDIVFSRTGFDPFVS
jgi:FkbM family methyltransferase